MSNQALTPAQKAQITKQRKKLEEQAYAARLEEQGRGARTTKTKALDNAVWRGAAPTGHAPTQKQSTKKPAQQRRRLPPSIASSGDSDEYVSEAPQPPKRPRLVNTAERLFDDDSNVDRPAPKPRKRSKPAIDDEDADVEEDYQDYHGPGEDDSADEGADSQPEDQDLIGITTTQLRSQLRNEVPHLEAEGPNTERSPSPGINIPDVDLEMTTTTEFEDFDNANQDDWDDAAAHANMRSRSGKRCKPSGGHRAQARRSEKPTFSDGANVPNTNCYPQPDTQPNTTSQSSAISGAHSSTDTNSPNYGWPVAAHYVAPPPSLPVSLKVQPSLLQQIIRTAIRSATGDYLFKTAYPSDKNHWKGLRTILRRCATRLELNEYAERFEKDVAFGEDIAQILVARFANRRGDVKSNASTCAAGYYSLLPGEECKDRVKDLTKSYTYIFPEEAGVMKRNKPFKHPCIIKVITKSFFESGRGGRSSLADKHSKLFSSSCEEGPKRDELELPIPIVALAATAVHCALLEWKTGEHSKLSFHGDTYQPVYERHVKVLEDIRNDHAKYHRMMADLYKTVSRGKNTAGEVNTAALVDLAAMEE
ncbi:hypothetical protein BC835DRAFT_1433959 [Cytidiella melzeri]|nr:hypothetical protein BC835DRAFT_1433959 [Cytidiella melzeri]